MAPTGRHGAPAAPRVTLREYRVFAGAAPHDVAPARDGTVWFTAQSAGELGRLDPGTGRSRRVPLGQGSAQHGVILGPFETFGLRAPGANIRQLLVRRGEVWGAESGADRLVVARR